MIAKTIISFILVGMLTLTVRAEDSKGPSSQADIETKLRELRKTHPTGLLIVEAHFGEGSHWVDVREKLQSMVKAGELSVHVDFTVFGDPSPNQVKKLVTTYDDDGHVATVETAEQETLVLGRTGSTGAVVDSSKGGMSDSDLKAALEKYRSEHGDGLIILEAQWGVGTRCADVREFLQNSVVGNDLNQTVGIGWPGDPAYGTVKDLTVSYWDGSQIQTWHGKDGATLALHGLKSGIKSDLDKYRKEHGEGLIVLEARWGAGNTSADMREFLQGSVNDDSLDLKVGEGWPNDPVYGTVKDLTVSYCGMEPRSRAFQTGKDGAAMTLHGTKPAAFSEIHWLPDYVAEGQRISHNFGKAGTFKLESGPQGATINSAGLLSWTPTGEQVGLQKVHLTITAGGT